MRPLDEERYQFALARRAEKDRFDALLEIYQGRIARLFGDKRPDCILVCLPEELATFRIANPALTDGERRALERLQAEKESSQLSLFSATPEEELLTAELQSQAEELLFRSFYRALKAHAMSDSNPVPLQVLRRHTYIESEAKQSEGTRAWNLSSALYYKSGRIPWRPNGLSSETCYVGISFHHLRRRGGGIVYASVAQAFANDLEPFALKGASISPDQRREHEPYLTQQQSEELIDRVLDTYKDQTGGYPSRVVIHKTTWYDPEEQNGFRVAALKRVPACDLISIGETSFRLLRKGMQEPWRGTLCTVGKDEHYLFTTGFVPDWDEYPGPHIPAPLQIGCTHDTDIRERSREILALSKMNWNSAEGVSRYPITLSFARKVGAIMMEMTDNPNPNPSYRFYMWSDVRLRCRTLNGSSPVARSRFGQCTVAGLPHRSTKLVPAARLKVFRNSRMATGVANQGMGGGLSGSARALRNTVSCPGGCRGLLCVQPFRLEAEAWRGTLQPCAAGPALAGQQAGGH